MVVAWVVGINTVEVANEAMKCNGSIIKTIFHRFQSPLFLFFEYFCLFSGNVKGIRIIANALPCNCSTLVSYIAKVKITKCIGISAHINITFILILYFKPVYFSKHLVATVVQFCTCLDIYEYCIGIQIIYKH